MGFWAHTMETWHYWELSVLVSDYHHHPRAPCGFLCHLMSPSQHCSVIGFELVFLSVLFLLPSLFNEIPSSPQLKNTLSNRGSAQPSPSLQSHIVSAVLLCVTETPSPSVFGWFESPVWSQLTNLECGKCRTHSFSCVSLPFKVFQVCSSGQHLCFQLLRWALSEWVCVCVCSFTYGVYSERPGFDKNDFIFWFFVLISFLSVFTVQTVCSANGTAEQGELISRIKSLELENQSLHKGGFVCRFWSNINSVSVSSCFEMFWCS